MVIDIEPGAEEYVGARGGSIFLMPEDSAAACCGSIHERPKVRLGKPRDIDRHDAHAAGKVTCYAPRAIACEQHVTIRLNWLLGIRWLSVDGWKVL